MFFNRPADCWLEGLPLGNGRMAAMAMGYPLRECICLNHEAVWRKILNRKTKVCASYLPRIRKHLLGKDWEKGARLLVEKFQPEGDVSGRVMYEYQPAGNLIIESLRPEPVTGYSRILDLKNGLIKINFATATAKYERTNFVSAVHNVLVTRLKCAGDRPLSVALSLERENSPDCRLSFRAHDNCQIMTADIQNGVMFRIKNKVILSKGRISSIPGQSRFVISGAHEILILTTIQVEANKEETAIPENYDLLLKEHVRDHRRFFGRVDFSLNGGNHGNPRTTDALMRDAFNGAPPDHLFELMLKMGRYLLIAGSRPGSKALNLQGKWNRAMHPAWQSDYHLDMNMQMAYWPAESGNLSEFTQPLFDFVQNLIPDGMKNAKNYYGCNGVVFPIACAGEGQILPGAWAAWTGAAGWLAQHFWQHYEYTLDEKFLKDVAYPYMRKVADFYMDFLIKNKSGKYVIAPSTSPENIPLERGGKWQGHKMITTNATMDIAIIRELFGNLLTAGGILRQDLDEQGKWREILDHLPDWPVDKNGMLKEWANPVNRDNPKHRHFSHLYPLFPGNMFSLEDTSVLIKSAAKALKARQDCGLADNAGWSYPYMALLHARLGGGDKALQCLAYLAKSCMMDNLLTIHNDWRFQGLSLYWPNGDRLFQIEATLGASAAIIEMLLQSHNGLIRILPALPRQWKHGHIKGLKARGGFIVDIFWKDGAIENVVIHSLAGQDCRVKLCRPHGPVKIKCGKRLITGVETTGNYIKFNTVKGRKYQLSQQNERL